MMELEGTRQFAMTSRGLATVCKNTKTNLVRITLTLLMVKKSFFFLANCNYVIFYINICTYFTDINSVQVVLLLSK